MTGRFFLFIWVCIALGIVSCQHKKNGGEARNLSQGQVTEKLLEANKAAIEIENAQIDSLISHSGWKTTKTATGLRYQILEKGRGPETVSGKIIKFDYEVKLISGEVAYTSDNTGAKEFRIGSGGVESGLEEGILLLRVGDKARLIIPSYLAHGLSGDQDRIPPKATLIYTLKLIDLK